MEENRLDTISTSTRSTIFKSIAKLLLWGIILYALFQLGTYRYIAFHTAVELFAIITAFVVFAVVINTYEISQNNFLTSLGISFGFIALLEILHAFTSDGISMFGIMDTNKSVQLWIATRYLQSLTVLLAFVFYKALGFRIHSYAVIAVYIIIVSAVILSIFYYKSFPVCYIDGKGMTAFKRISEYITSCIFIISAILLIAKRKNIRFKLYRSVLFFMLASAASGLVFALAKGSADEVMITGHLLKLLSYYFFYTAVMVTALKNPITLMFYELENVKNELAEKNLEVIQTNEQLMQEISDLQMIEKLLRKSKAWSRAIFEGSSIGIVLLNVNGIIIESNPAFERILGYNSEELRDIGIQKITHPDDLDHDMKLFNDLINGSIDSYEIEKRYVRRDGSIIWGNLKMSYILNTGEDFQFIIAMIEDITQRKLAEENRLRLLKELETTNQELDNFAYIVSHDLKAPLRGIGSLANWLITDYGDKFDSEGKDIINLMINRVDRMKNFIEGILQYSRVSRINDSKELLDLNKVVDEVLELLALPDNITVNIENKLPEISCYKIFIEQIFQNLLSNAVKFMDKPEGVVNIDCQEEDEHWKISISDNGTGIDERYYKKIFQIFQTLQPRDKFESTGIGLSIVKKIIDTIGGKIWVESTPGEGSTFYFTIPKN
ncbi:MAG: MASE3 domain-containing protein [Bacillota bacterium]